jgi:ketosteroid isomerase-like protein
MDSVRGMSLRKQVVETYIEGFRRSDHAMILGCLTENVVWDIHGYTSLEGRDAFDAEIQNEAFVGSPTLAIDQLIEDDDVVVAVGRGEAMQTTGDVLRFVFSDVFTFCGDKIRRLETYQVNLS